MSRFASTGLVLPVRKGLYWKGPRTERGMLPPLPGELGLEIGGPGSGPCGLSAARFLGLTTQVPVTMDIAVPGRAPMPVAGVEFHSRPYSRLLHRLKPAEVAVTEVLRSWPSGVEADWQALSARVSHLVREGVVRPGIVSLAVSEERTPLVKNYWKDLHATLTS